MKRARAQQCKQPCGLAQAQPDLVRFVFRGDQYWVVPGEPPAMLAALLELTPAEEQVLELLRAGSSYEQIAASRGRSRHTVAKQVTSILRKLKVASRRDLELLRSSSWATGSFIARTRRRTDDGN